MRILAACKTYNETGGNVDVILPSKQRVSNNSDSLNNSLPHSERPCRGSSKHKASSLDTARVSFQIVSLRRHRVALRLHQQNNIINSPCCCYPSPEYRSVGATASAIGRSSSSVKQRVVVWSGVDFSFCFRSLEATREMPTTKNKTKGRAFTREYSMLLASLADAPPVAVQFERQQHCQ